MKILHKGGMVAMIQVAPDDFFPPLPGQSAHCASPSYRVKQARYLKVAGQRRQFQQAGIIDWSPWRIEAFI